MTTVVRPDDIDTPTMPEPHVRERVASGVSAIPVLGAVIVLILGAGALIPVSVVTTSAPVIVLGAVLFAAAAILAAGLIMVAPGEARVIQFFGNPVEIVAVVVWQVADTNLLVVLCGDREPQPVVNTGTLYQ